ncbi:MAG TPA: tetratricopeptide repeat protein [Pirellulales bacterium]|nr:tetratricopeptide repeat protein [Pirellulales bacterium]
MLVAVFLLLVVGAQARAGDDTVRMRPSGTAKGSISLMTSTEVALDMAAGQKKQIPVNEIDSISYDGEPPELKLARSESSNGNYEGALKSLDKIDPAKVNRPEIKHDLQFYRAFCHARLALAGSGDIPKAGSEMRQFVKENPTNYHFLVAAETLGDLFAAIGRPELAFEQYATVERAPWPEYKMRGGVAKGRILVAQKKYPEALATFDAVLKLTGDEKGPAASLKLAAQLGKATCLAATGQPDPAIAAVQAVIDNADPEDNELNARAYLTLGNCYRQKEGATKDALLAYLHVDLLYPSNREAHAEALSNLARLWNELGKPERALQATQLLKDRYASTVWAKQ